jgi:hypothetical protein
MKQKTVKHKIYDKNGDLKEVTLIRRTAIKALCTECMGFEDNPKNCMVIHCPLYPFRGKTLLSYPKKCDSTSKEV